MTSAFTQEIKNQAKAVKEQIDREYWRAIKYDDKEKKAEIEQLYKEMGEKPNYDGYKELGEKRPK